MTDSVWVVIRDCQRDSVDIAKVNAISLTSQTGCVCLMSIWCAVASFSSF